MTCHCPTRRRWPGVATPPGPRPGGSWWPLVRRTVVHPRRRRAGARDRALLRGRRLVVRGHRSDVRKVGRKALDIQLEDPQRPAQVLEAMLAEVTERCVGWQIVSHQIARRLREQDLAPVAGRPDPGCAVDIHAHVAGRRDDRFARVETHPNADGHPTRPDVSGQCSLGVGGAGDRLLGAGERGEERVALGVHLVTMPALEQRSQELALVLKDLCVLAAQAVEETGRPLDVGEQERHGASGHRKNGHRLAGRVRGGTGRERHVRSPAVMLGLGAGPGRHGRQPSGEPPASAHP